MPWCDWLLWCHMRPQRAVSAGWSQRLNQRKILAQTSHWSCQIVHTRSWDGCGCWWLKVRNSPDVSANESWKTKMAQIWMWLWENDSQIKGQNCLGLLWEAKIRKKNPFKNNWRLLKRRNIISKYTEKKSQAAVIKQQFKVLMVKSPFKKKILCRQPLTKT